MMYHDYNEDLSNKETEVNMMEQLFDDIYDKLKDQLKKVQMYTLENNMMEEMDAHNHSSSSSSRSSLSSSYSDAMIG